MKNIWSSEVGIHQEPHYCANPCNSVPEGYRSILAAPINAIFQLKFCKTRENSNFLKNGKTVISVKIQNFSRSRMTKRTSLLESSREI